MNEPAAAANGAMVYLQPIIDDFTSMGVAARQFLPVLVQGLVILAILLILAGIIKFIIRSVCTKLKLDALSEKAGLSNAFSKLGISSPLSSVLSSVVFWMVALYAIKAAADVWGIADISQFVNGLIIFLPKLFVSLLILLAGILVADMMRKAVHKALTDFGIEYGAIIGNILFGLLVVMIATVVLGQLGIETDLLNATVKIVLASVGLAVAIALGFGLRPVARNVVSGVYARDLYPPGSLLEIDGSTGVVREVGAVATRLELKGGEFIVVPNSCLVTEINRGARTSREFADKL